MDRLVILMIFLYSFNSLALTLINEKKEPIEFNKHNDYMITKNCKSNCMAKSIFKLKKEKVKSLIDSHLREQVTLGALLCENSDAKIYIYRDEKKRQVSICRFKDNSSVLISNLSEFALKNYQE